MTDTSLETLFPTGKTTTVRGVEITIKPFRFGDLSKVFKAADPILGTLLSALNAGNGQFEAISKVVAESGDNVVDLMVIGTKQPRAWVEELDMDEGIDLFISILEVNADFFVRKVLPGLNKRIEKAVGQTQ